MASLAIRAPEKWTDNLLAHHDLPGIQSRTRGVARGISWPALIHIALTREIHTSLGCSVRDAIVLAAALLDASVDRIPAGSHLSISFDRERFEHDLHQQLADALESAPRPRRGRPRRRALARQ